MSQATPIIGPNKSGLSYRQEDNDGKKALLTQHKGPSAPVYAEAGVLWLDDSATPWALKFYDGADWLPVFQVHAGNNTVLPYAGASPLNVPILSSDTGSANAYAVNPSPAVSGYTAGQMVLLRPTNANSGSSTLAVNGLSAVSIRMPDGSNTPAGALKTSGTYLLVHTGSYFSLLNPTANQGAGSLQLVSATYSGSAVNGSIVPLDDTVPTSSEGTELISVSITPKSATSKMLIRAQGMGGCNTATVVISSIFVNSSSSALYATADSGTGSVPDKMSLYCEHTPGSMSALTYKLRVGVSSGSVRYNGSSSGRMFGGGTSWFLTVEEYEQ